ncbi:MAG: hypothetical protein IH945_12345 [Armatimonadetes bacterium]|nr:hypothetical protein [Armatimonadota bacterium]
MTTGVGLAQMPLDGGQLVGIVLGGLALVIPIAAMIMNHQRKMAETLRKQPGQELLPEVVAELQQLRHEVQAMRSELNANTIAIDDAEQRSLSPPPTPTGIEQRIAEE